MKNKPILKFKWTNPFLGDSCCHGLDYKGQSFGLICENGRVAAGGEVIRIFGSLEEKKKQLERYAVAQEKINKVSAKIFKKAKLFC